jgi:hypothetical protein
MRTPIDDAPDRPPVLRKPALPFVNRNRLAERWDSILLRVEWTTQACAPPGDWGE